MIVRGCWFVMLVVVAAAGFAPAARSEVMASFKSPAVDPSIQVGVAAYRAYVKAQADALVGMTRVLAREVKNGDLDAAQSSYAPAHRFLKRIEPIAFVLHDLHRSIDARADMYRGKEADSSFSGFHRVEYGLFAKRTTSGLAIDAVRLDADAREFRDRIVIAPITAGAMVDGVVQLVKEIADKKLGGEEEAYSRTDLWDLEANIDGVQQVVFALEPSLEDQHADIFVRTKAHFDRIGDLLAKQKDGCGFRNYDEVSKDDKAALKTSILALGADLSMLRGVMTVD